MDERTVSYKKGGGRWAVRFGGGGGGASTLRKASNNQSNRYMAAFVLTPSQPGRSYQGKLAQLVFIVNVQSTAEIILERKTSAKIGIRHN